MSYRYMGFAQDIRFSRGSLHELGDIAAQYGWQRILVVTSPSHRNAGRAGDVEQQLGQRVVASFDSVLPHVQEEQVRVVVELAQSHHVDAIVALGGGSVLGMGKAASDAIQLERTGKFARDADPLTPALVPVVAVPTTYAGSEMTTVYGVTRDDEGVRRKMTVSGRNIVPRVVIYDPELTVGMPSELTGTSAMNALAHCFEALYSPQRNPLSTWASLGGIRSIFESLPAAVRDPEDLDARTRLLDGAFLAGAALSQVAMGIHHGVCHVLGGSAGVPHGVANTIVLPHALRFNQVAAASDLAEVAHILRLGSSNDDPVESTGKVIDELERMIEHLGLPSSLSEYGVAEADLPALAGIAMKGEPVRRNTRPVRDAGEIEAFLRAIL